MIWVFVIAVLASAAIALVTARSWPGRGAVLAAAAIALAAYAVVGRPATPDQPLAQRLEALGEVDPDEMSLDQRLALWQSFSRMRPEDPTPHRYIGDLLAASGREAAALRAYQSALRRDPQHAPAMRGFADLLVRDAGGDISEQASDLYAAAFAINPNDVMAGFMAGMRDWQSGDHAKANAYWDTVDADLPPDGPLRAGLAQLRSGLQRAQPAPSPRVE